MATAIFKQRLCKPSVSIYLFFHALSSAVLSARHSRAQETEADDYGYEFLADCGKNPWAMAIAFEKMKKLSKRNNARWAKFLQAFSTHPDFDTRIERMSRRARDEGYERP